MQPGNGQGLPASLLNGRLEGLSVPDLLWNICRRHATGVLHVSTRGITKKVYIDSGKIIFAGSGDMADRLGNLLLRDGLITLDQLEAANLQLSGGKRLGTILVDAGHLTPEHLVRGVLAQVKNIVLSLFPLEEGDYAFAEGPLPTDEVITLNIKTAEILLQGIRQVRSFSRIRRSVGPPSTRFRLDPAWRSIVEGLDVREGERLLLQRLDESRARGISVEALCREVFLSNFEIYQALWALLVLGALDHVDREQPAGADGAISAVLRATLPEILVRLSRGRVTGVLHMARGHVERSLHIRDGQCIFATSNSVDDGLLAHLLRRGVISLSDREETARRLLSNKRVGAILVEMGVIDEGDLKSAVTEQISEIVFDTFRWDQGDFQFREGDLPTAEVITLQRTVEDLVFAGVRRITSWPRVREGCGGLGARLVLRPEYLEILDNTTIGPEEWELISLLKSPKTLLEICRESMLGDFRSCQILWALRLLGGVGEAPVEVSIDSALGTLEAPAARPAPIEEPRAEAPVADAPVAAEGAAQEHLEEPAEEPSEPPAPLPLSEVDDTAEVISEPWRLAAERAPEAPEQDWHAPEPQEPVREELTLDSPADATLYIPRETVEAALRASETPPVRFELEHPGVGVEDTNVDMHPEPAETELEAPAESPEVEPVEAFDPVPMEVEAPLQDPGRTMQVPRETIDALFAEPIPAAEEAPKAETPKAPEPPPLPPFEPPASLDASIASFNARHVMLFRALRVEIGAGAANFVRSCRGMLHPVHADMFAATELRFDGSWDPEGLKQAVIHYRVADAPEAFGKLLDGELQRLRAHLGESRIAALAAHLSD